MNIFKFSKVQRSVGIHLFLTKICIYFICDFRFYCKDLSIRKLSIIRGFSASSFHWLTSRLFFVTFNVVNEYSSSLHFGHKFQSHINHLNKISKKTEIIHTKWYTKIKLTKNWALTSLVYHFRMCWFFLGYQEHQSPREQGTLDSCKPSMLFPHNRIFETWYPKLEVIAEKLIPDWIKLIEKLFWKPDKGEYVPKIPNRLCYQQKAVLVHIHLLSMDHSGLNQGSKRCCKICSLNRIP